MSGFIGYDVERIVWLRDAMRRAADELRRAEMADPAATGPMCRLRRVRSIFGDVWLPTIEGLIEIDMKAPASSSTLFDLDAWHPPGPGFAAGRFPGAGATADRLERAISRVPTLLVTEAVALAEFLDESDLRSLLTSDPDLDRLAERLSMIAADPLAAAAFRSAFEGWNELITILATERLATDVLLAGDPDWRGAADRLDRYDDLLDGLGTVLTAGSDQAHRAATPPILEQLDPYAAALLLAHLELDGVLLADAATKLLRRWREWPAGSAGWMDSHLGGDNAADVVFRILATDPTAATLFLEASTERPDTVVLGAQDPGSVALLLQVGTDPGRVDPDRVGAIVIPLVEWLRGDNAPTAIGPEGSTHASRAALAEVLATWVLYLGPRAEQWGWSYEDGDEALRWVIEDDTGLRRFVDGLLADQAALGVLSFSETDGRVEDLLVREQTMMFAQLESAIADERHADAVRDEFWVDLAFTSIRLVAGRILMPTATGLTAFARDVAVTTAVDLARRTLERQHVLPASSEEVAARARRNSDQRRVERAVIATVTVVAQLVELGEVDPRVLDELELDDPSGDTGGECGARGTTQRLDDWVDGLATRLSPAQHNLVVAVRNGFLNQQDVVDICR